MCFKNILVVAIELKCMILLRLRANFGYGLSLLVIPKQSMYNEIKELELIVRKCIYEMRDLKFPSAPMQWYRVQPYREQLKMYLLGTIYSRLCQFQPKGCLQQP